MSIKRNRSIFSKVFTFLMASMLIISSVLAQELSYDDFDENTLMDLEDVIVTGVASQSQTKLESTIAITVLNSEDMAKIQPQSIADLLESVPGFFPEDSGGETKNNLSARGTFGNDNNLIGMHADGLPTAYGDILQQSLSKVDLMNERLEVIRGGTSGIVSPRGTVSMINLITRKGTSDREGMVRVTYADYGSTRTDMYYSGPLTDEWVFALGGYYRSGDGLRDRGFRADIGGQFRVNLTRKLEAGSLTLRYHYLDDQNAFYLPIPLTGDNGDTILGGIDVNDGTLASVDNRFAVVPTPEGQESYDLQTGLSSKANIFGLDFDKKWGNSGWSMKEQFKYTSYSTKGNAVYPRGNNELQPARDRLAAEAAGLLAAFPSATKVGYAYATTGELIPDSEIDTLNGNGLTQKLEFRHFGSEMRQWVNQLTVRHETEKNSAALGSVIIDAVYPELFRFRNRFLSDISDGARKLDIVALNASNNVVGQLTKNGFSDLSAERSDGKGELQSTSLFFLDEYKVNDNLRLDIGLRWEEYTNTGVAKQNDANVAIVGSQNDPLVLVDDSVKVWPNGNTAAFGHKSNDTAWSVGFNYRLNTTTAFYGHYTDTFFLQSELFREVSDIGRASGPRFGTREVTSKLKFFELGVRYSGAKLGLSATLYNTTFQPISLNVQVSDGADGFIDSNVKAMTEAWGIEYEAQWNLSDWFTLEIIGVLQDTQLKDVKGLLGGVNAEGNQIQRVPNVQTRISPEFHIADNTDIFFTYHYMSKRYENLANTAPLPSYATLSAGIQVKLSDELTLMFKGTNLTNEIGLSEGNFRDTSTLTGADIGNTYYARSIFGRTVSASASYSF